ELANEDSLTFEKLLKEKTFEALKNCIEVSLKIAKLCLEIVKDIEAILENGNENIISDLGISLELIKSALNSSKYNILINLKSSKDEEFNIKILNEFKEIEEKFIFFYEAFSSKISLKLY
ncbi:MAG: cyclodeaminase/cyclohydrolase family protein, partial [Candidatus Hydrothermia bacterium]